ncbi:ATP-binding protein [Patescibacteria group bacterium]|nr:ATP-binding protein [Patescibacteria group bacterium]
MIRRLLLKQLQTHLPNPEITLIVGPRQAGKTTLMEIMRDDLKKSGAKTIFLNLDFTTDLPFFESQEKLLQRISYELGHEKGYVFIDEIQRKENAGLFLKGLYDKKLPYKFIVSGSGSLELREKIHESLPGRKRLFELSTISFEEFVNYKHDTSTESRFYPDFTDLTASARTGFEFHREMLSSLLDEYLTFGGYPKVVLAPAVEEKRAIIADIYQSFLEKDMSILLRLKKTESLTALLRILASQIGNIVHLTELSNTLGISVQTVKQYLWYLEKTYMISKVTPYFKNTRKEITKSPVYYFVDAGLRNFAVNQFGTIAHESAGFLFQNFVFNTLKEDLKLTPAGIHFWRTKDRAEVDFVLHTAGEVIPIEVKYATLKKPELSRSFRSFLTKYKVLKAYIVNLSLTQEIAFEGTTIYFVPFFNIQVLHFLKQS